MRGFYALLVALGSLLGYTGEVHAQGEIEQLTVSLLPQYDDPRLLIVYEARMREAGEVILGVPPAVELSSVAYRAEDGTLQEVDARFDAASDGRFIRFASPATEVRLTLYQDVIPRQAERFVDFTLPAQRYDIETLQWLAMFPPDATRVKVVPEMELRGQNHFGMAEYGRDAGALAAGTQATQSIEWYREGSEPVILVPDEASTAATDASLANKTAIYLGAGATFLLGAALVVRGVWAQRRNP